MKAVLVTLGLLLGGVLLLAMLGLGWVHADIRRASGPLPEASAILALRGAADRPVRVRAINTASQRVPRSGVLAPSRDPDPAAPYVLGHTAFLLEWTDGRRLLVDAGMDREAAEEFGAPAELIGADSIEAHGSVARQLGSEAAGPLAVVFSHLHTDHTQGLIPLCRARGDAPVTVFQTRMQAGHHNYTTRPGADAIREAGCGEIVLLAEESLTALPGFAGVAVAHAGGHTPGSQVVFAAVGDTLYAFLGDIVNNVDGARRDVPKPFAYRLLVVPEADGQLGRWRRLLGRLERESGAVLAPAHDQLHLEAIGLLRSQ